MARNPQDVQREAQEKAAKEKEAIERALRDKEREYYANAYVAAHGKPTWKEADAPAQKAPGLAMLSIGDNLLKSKQYTREDVTIDFDAENNTVTYVGQKGQWFPGIKDLDKFFKFAFDLLEYQGKDNAKLIYPQGAVATEEHITKFLNEAEKRGMRVDMTDPAVKECIAKSKNRDAFNQRVDTINAKSQERKAERLHRDKGEFEQDTNVLKGNQKLHDKYPDVIGHTPAQNDADRKANFTREIYKIPAGMTPDKIRETQLNVISDQLKEMESRVLKVNKVKEKIEGYLTQTEDLVKNNAYIDVKNIDKIYHDGSTKRAALYDESQSEIRDLNERGRIWKEELTRVKQDLDGMAARNDDQNKQLAQVNQLLAKHQDLTGHIPKDNKTAQVKSDKDLEQTIKDAQEARAKPKI